MGRTRSLQLREAPSQAVEGPLDEALKNVGDDNRGQGAAEDEGPSWRNVPEGLRDSGDDNDVAEVEAVRDAPRSTAGPSR